MKKQETYLVTFGDTTEVRTEEELQNFINYAVIRNKYISSFSVEHVDDPTPMVKELLNDSRARAARMALVTHLAGIDAETVVIEARRILVNLNNVIKLLGYGENSKN